MFLLLENKTVDWSVNFNIFEMLAIVELQDGFFMIHQFPCFTLFYFGYICNISKITSKTTLKNILA